ncbi:MAG: hypothetical protein ACYC8T_31795 [Myxococcaceae bacterium]
MPSLEVRPAAAGALAISRLRLLELAALVLAALFALSFHARLPGRVAAEADYRRLGELLAAERAQGDVVLLFPWWTERARLFVPDGLPVVGYLGSDQDPLTPHPRIWVVSQPRLPGSSPDAFEQAFLPGRSPLGAPRALGNLTLTLYRNDRHREVLFSAAEAFASARVYLERPGGGRTDCAFDGRQHRCPGGGGLHVGPEWHELKYVPRRCLWLHPPGGASRLVAEFPLVPAGSRLSLEGGVIWEHAYRHDPAVTVTRIGVDQVGTGRTLLELSLPPGLEGLQRSAAASSTLPAPLAVKLWVQSDNADGRETCVDLFSLGPSAAEGP